MKNKLSRIFFVLVFSWICWVSPVFSSDYDLASLEFGAKTSSNDINRSRVVLDYRSQRRAYFWPYVELVDSSLDWGGQVFEEGGTVESNDYTGRKAEVFLGGRPTPYIYLEGRLGYHQLASEVSADDASTTAIRFLGFYEIARGIKVKGEFQRDFLYASSVGVSAVGEALMARTGVIGGEWQPVLPWRFLARSVLQKSSDSNTMRQNTLEALYGISPEWPWIWSGAFVETLRFDNKTDGYWSPQDFKSFGVKLESSFPINQSFSATAGFNLSRSQERNEPWGTGYFIGAGVDYLFMDNYHLIVSISRNESLQDESVWKENSAKVSIKGSL